MALTPTRCGSVFLRNWEFAVRNLPSRKIARREFDRFGRPGRFRLSYRWRQREQGSFGCGWRYPAWIADGSSRRSGCKGLLWRPGIASMSAPDHTYAAAGLLFPILSGGFDLNPEPVAGQFALISGLPTLQSEAPFQPRNH